MSRETIDILIDFDGTCVTHDFPNVGKDIGAQPVLKKLIDKGHNLILFTMRSDKVDATVKDSGSEILDISGDFLSQAVKWFKDNDIPLYGIQGNPTQGEWTDSPKAYGQLIIDDIGLGIPLAHNSRLSNRNFVNWEIVESLLKLKGIL